MHQIKFKNSFFPTEYDGLKKMFNNKDIYIDNKKVSVSEFITEFIMNKDLTEITITIDTPQDFIESLTEEGFPFLSEEIKEDKTISGVFFDGVNKTELRYLDGERFFPAEIAEELIHMLENSFEMQALIILNQHVARTDISILQRLKKVKN